MVCRLWPISAVLLLGGDAFVLPVSRLQRRQSRCVSRAETELAPYAIVRGAISAEELKALRHVAACQLSAARWADVDETLLRHQRRETEGRRGVVAAFVAEDGVVREVFERTALQAARRAGWERPSPGEYSLNDVQVCAYGVGDFFDRHLDDITRGRAGMRRITTVVSLSDGYEGGELELEGHTDLALKSGDAVVFEAGSCEHAVSPVTAGLRVSMVFGIFWRHRPFLFLLDRDGVINHDVGSPGVLSRRQLKVFDGIARAIDDLRRRGHRVVVVTNQSAVKKQLMTISDLHEVHAEMLGQLEAQHRHTGSYFDAILFATGLSCGPKLKPAPDLVLDALRSTGIDKSRAILIGDAETDIAAAYAADIPAILVTSSHHGKRVVDSLEQQSDTHEPYALAAALRSRQPAATLCYEGSQLPVAAVFPSLLDALNALTPAIACF